MACLQLFSVPAVYKDGSLGWFMHTLHPVEIGQQWPGALGYPVVWPGEELVLSDLAKVAGTLNMLQGLCACGGMCAVNCCLHIYAMFYINALRLTFCILNILQRRYDRRSAAQAINLIIHPRTTLFHRLIA